MASPFASPLAASPWNRGRPEVFPKGEAIHARCMEERESVCVYVCERERRVHLTEDGEVSKEGSLPSKRVIDTEHVQGWILEDFS